MSDQHIIVCRDVKKTFKVKGRAPVHALRGIDFVLDRGSMVAIKGDSGSGKSTLLHILGALDVPTFGTVTVNGKNLSSMSRNELTEYRSEAVGFVFQSFYLIPNLSALENVEMPMEIRKVPRHERKERATMLLKEVGLEGRTDHKPSKLSGGEQQRVAIARALANDPPIILADEPAGNLDLKTGRAIIMLLNQLMREHDKTIIIATHMEKAAMGCDRTFKLKDGLMATPQSAEATHWKRTARDRVRSALDVSGKILSMLFDSGYTELDDIAVADRDDIYHAVGDPVLAGKIIEKARTAITKNSGGKFDGASD